MVLVTSLRRIASRSGVDEAVGFTVLARMWQLGAGVLTVILVVRFLTPIQQGFQYTFASILGLQVFVELGLSVVILQFASHECAHLEWSGSGTLVGDPVARARLASLLRSALRWYGVVGGSLLLGILPFGLSFFSKGAESQAAGSWRLPWTILVGASAGLVACSPLLAFLEGCGRIGEVARWRFFQDLLVVPFYWLGLVAGGGLYASAVAQAFRLVLVLGWIVALRKEFFVDVWGARKQGVGIHWWSEVWPMQWRIAVSWISGYMVLQLFTPILFAYFGAVVAGQMGMTLTLTGTITTMAFAFVATKAPAFGGLIARKEYGELDRKFVTALRRALVVAVAGGACLVAATEALRANQVAVTSRILGTSGLVMLVVSAIANVVPFSLGTYLRAHKREPFLIVSLWAGGLMGLSTYFLGRKLGPNGMAAGYLAVTVVGSLIPSLVIFFRKRREWHAVGGGPVSSGS